jgi:hypothetical protein
MKIILLALLLLAGCVSAEREMAFDACLDEYFDEPNNPIILGHTELIRLCRGMDPVLWSDTRIKRSWK